MEFDIGLIIDWIWQHKMWLAALAPLAIVIFVIKAQG